MCLNNWHVEKGDRVFIFMPRSPELILPYWVLLNLERLLVLCLKHLWRGLFAIDLADSEAKVIVTTNELLSRVPVEDLPSFKTYFCRWDDD